MLVDRRLLAPLESFLRGIVTAVWLAAALPAAASAEDTRPLRGVALVLGQSEYEHLPKLANPGNDARSIEAILDALGFETDIASNRSARKLKRDFETFVEDAQGADVALIYYSGHGIEAGGEDFLVPVDADLGSLEDAEESFVSLSRLLDTLRMRVKITIVLLDSCRTNPFPPGALLSMRPGGPASSIGATGLAATRSAESAFPIADSAQAPGQSFGEVVGFAAAPNQAALDGVSGGNSPYAAALLKHLTTGGMEFSQIMTLVAEEVYLSTNGQQQPWTNASLRRLLFFGDNPEERAGDEATIRGERRSLLLTIAATADDLKRTVETISRVDEVPLDGLYAMLNSLGVDASGDPTRLDKQLRAGSEKLKAFLGERAALRSTDPEIVRLSGLADRAVREGALQAAIAFHERAKARIANLEADVGEAEAEVQARRLEFGEVFARSARTSELSFDYLAAADDWGKAYDQVERWDARLAYSYKLAQANALSDYGDYQGDNDALEQSIDLYRDALLLAPRDTRPDDWAVTQTNLANAVWTLGERDSSAVRLEEAVAAYRGALEVNTREHAPFEWALTQTNLGNALSTLGDREGGTERLEEAVAAYRAALEVNTRERAPLNWATTQNNLGTVLSSLGRRESGTGRLEEAVAAYRAALGEWTRERVPLDWAMTQNNLGNALSTLGERESGTGRLEEAVAAYRAALEEWTRERVPLDWATTQNNLGIVLSTLGARESGTGRLKEAVVAYDLALREFTRGRVPLDWAMTQNNLGLALWWLGGREDGTQRLEAAVAVYRAALEERTRDRVPLQWAATTDNLGLALTTLGERESGTQHLEEAVVAHRAALEERTRERVPLQWAMTQNNLGLALATLGERKGGTKRLDEAITAYRAALEERPRDRVPLQWAATQKNLGDALTLLGEPGIGHLEEAVAAYRAALEVRTRERVPLDWAWTQDKFGWALKLLGGRNRDIQMVQEGKDRITAAWDFFKSAGYDHDDYFSKRMAEFDGVLAEIR